MIDERVLDARRRAEANLPATMRHVMVERWGRLNFSRMSRETGVPTSTVRNHLIGSTPVPADDLAGYAAALGVPAWLFFGTSEDAIRWLREHSADDPDSLSRAIPGSRALAA